MAAPVVEGYTSNTVIPGSSLTLTKPAGVQPGDLLIILVGNDDSTATAQWNNTTYKPTGFTLINESGNATCDTHTAAFYRIADGSEGPTIAVPAQSSDDYWGFYIRISGVDVDAPINKIGADVNTGSLVGSIAIVGVTTDVDECLAIYIHSYDGGDCAAFNPSGTGWTEKEEIRAGTGSGNSSGSWGMKEQTSLGATGTVTVSGTPTDGWSGFQFAIAPSAGGEPILVEITDTIGLSDLVLLNKAALVQDSVGLSDGLLLDKMVVIAEAIGLSDSVYAHKAITIVDSVGLVDVIELSKLITIEDEVVVYDSVLADKLLLISDTSSLMDEVLADKALLVEDGVALSDSITADKMLIISDVSTVADEVYVDKMFVVAETVAIGDSVLTDKDIVIPDSVSLLDSVKTDKMIIILELIGMFDGITVITGASSKGDVLMSGFAMVENSW